MSRLLEEHRKKHVKKIMKELGLKNVMEVPRLEKIVVNVGIGEAVHDPKIIDVISEDLMKITGQKPQLRRAKKSVASFHLREGMPIGLKVTLRGKRAFDFLDRLINFTLPRLRDFQGISRNSFDWHGNYTLGMDEQTIFPEIEMDKVKKVFGMDITMVSTAKTDEQAMVLLETLGFPFQRR
jgi:large subunit ribosomal protein L5